MRKNVTFLLSTLIAFTAFADKVAVISRVQGDVLLQKAEAMDYDQAVVMGTILETNDQIKVNDGFAVMLLLDDKSQVKLRENTEVAITMVEDLSGSAYHVRLDYGQALTKYTKGADFEFQLHTPTSVASIKGTEFWTISDPEEGDNVIVLEGVVDVMNNLTGMISTAGAGETVNSTTDGYIQTDPTEEGSIPEDPEEGIGEVEQGEDEEAASDSVATEEETVDEPVVDDTAVDEETPVVTTTPPPAAPAPKAEPEEDTEPESEGGGLFGDALAMNGALGAVTIDGVLYNQIALRPDISIGKLGIGLDLVFYMNQDGDVVWEKWQGAENIADKVMYVRWGQPEDPLYIRVGTLEKVVIGYGMFVNNYNNMMEYPSVRKIGTHVGFTRGSLGFEAMWANVKELGLASLRTTYSLGKLQFGVTAAVDINQYNGFKDDDDDGRPNIVDDFPDDDTAWLDSDGDGIEDKSDYDRDNDNILELGLDLNNDGEVDGFPGVLWEDPDSADVKPNPFNLKDKRSTLLGVSVDVGYPVFSNKILDILVFTEAGMYMGDHHEYTFNVANGLDSTEVKHGWGVTIPGIRASLFSFIHLGLEYRMTGENFVFGLMDQNYDLDRVAMQYFNNGEIMKPLTRDARMLNTTPMQGVFGMLSVDIFSLVTVNGAYQHMIQDGADPVKGIYGSIDLAKDLVPKLAGASAYLNRMNVDDPFDIYSEGTLMGYKVVFELGGGATLTWDMRTTFRDLDGDGEIDRDAGSDEVISSTVIETGFSF
ncbi:MAG: FecR family protein [Candidatus Marinimicrobia bacterium]|nr:FecR family protein [Candidatus Neomarinimicrobiota bacterium]MCF7904667.1 FecR family protein [Candidatus Neomarinimicrobiota bacterium]